jgi:basic amino acid/polyamine antiporter, APA family
MTELKRVVTLPQIVFYGLGNILGAGIYVLVGKVALFSGNYAIISFLIAALTACLTAFTYAELVSRYPQSAGAAIYVHHGFGKRWLSVLVGLLIVLTALVSSATITRGFIGYLSIFFIFPDWLVILLVLSALGTIAIWGINASVKTAIVLTLVEIFGLLLILVLGRQYFLELPDKITTFISPNTSDDLNGIMLGALLAFYAFIGFEDMVNVAEEVKDVERNMPLAIIISMAIATLIYVGISTLALLVSSPSQLGATDAPLAEIYTTITGKEPYLITIISLFAVLNGALVQIIMASRVLYGMSSKQWMPRWFGVLNQKKRTPVNATITVVSLIIIFTWLFPLVSLARATSFLLLIIFILVNLSLLIIKIRDENTFTGFCIPIYIPVFGLISCLVLIMSG